MPPRISRRHALLTAAGLPFVPAAAVSSPSPSHAKPARGRGGQVNLRVATYNASLNRPEEGQLVRDLGTGEDEQARAVARVIQINDPDVLLINEFDHDDDQRAVDLFRSNYLEVSQRGGTPVFYPYAYTAAVNTGVPSGMDLNQDGTIGGPDDAWGFGEFPGQYGMVLYSRFPIREDSVRTFRELTWQSMPDNLIPTEFYTDEQSRQLRLSSKSHWDVPIQVGATLIHMLAAHPTPPGFDGEEQRNLRRNHDEIRLWADYISPGRRSRWIVDDSGERGGLEAGSRFVILGDYNADPLDGDAWPGAIEQLLDHQRVWDPMPAAEGGVEASELQGGANDEHQGDPRFDTADFTDDAPGNLRVDYVLPSRCLTAVDSGVYWPRRAEPGSELTGEDPFPTSDHRLVRVDLRVPGY